MADADFVAPYMIPVMVGTPIGVLFVYGSSMARV